MRSVASTELPAWAEVSEKRRAHIERVTALLDAWAALLKLDAAQAQAWHDVGRLHDALRDAPDETLRALSGDASSPVELLHGPAAATLLEREGETRHDVLLAVRWHTVGCAEWNDVGRALYMADFLEPGRKFMQAERAFLAGAPAARLRRRVPRGGAPPARVVAARGKHLFPQSVALWNAVR
jgi:2-amino-4-hydroxy-6-hydroxymethyldihydropteridine diphosphokinase